MSTDPTHRFEATEGTREYKIYNDAFYDNKRIRWEDDSGTVRRGKVIGSRRVSLVEWEFQVLEVEKDER